MQPNAAHESTSPYTAPETFEVVRLTSKGYTANYCLLVFFTMGLAAGLVSGATTYIVNSTTANILLHLLPTGVAFTVSLWLGIGWFIDRMPWQRMISMIAGCLLSFVVTAIAYVQLTSTIAQPWTWDLLRPYIIAPAIGSILVATSVRLASHRTTLRVQLTTCLGTWLCGSLAFFAVDELGARRRVFYEPTLAYVCSTLFVTIVVSLIGWQLAEANCEQQEINSTTVN